MSVYSVKYNNAFDQSYNNITLDALFNYLDESDNYISQIFDNMGFTSFNESGSEDLYIFTEEAEETKKSIIERIKEIFKKFGAFVKRIFKTLAEKLRGVYKKINVQDKFVKNYSEYVTWHYITIAMEKGWPGYPNDMIMVGKPASAKDSSLYNEKDIDSFNLDQLLSPMVQMDATYEKAKECYDNFREKLNAWEEEWKKSETKDSMASVRKLKFGSDNNGKKINELNQEELNAMGLNLYFSKGPESDKDENCYYPVETAFVTSKYMAEKGEALVKQVEETGNQAINKLNVNKKEVELSKMKSFEKGGSNYEKNTEEINKIGMLYYKARYEYSVSYIKRCTIIVNNINEIIKEQHKAAIKFYAETIKVIRKYILNEKDEE